MTLPLPPGQTPRAWQIEALDRLRWGLSKYQRILLEAATGTGKGSLIAGIAEMSAKRGKRVLILAHRDELVREIPDRIQQIPGHSEVGIVKAEQNEGLCPIVSASVQSLNKRRLDRIFMATGGWDLVLTDEAHHATAPIYQYVYERNQEVHPSWKHIGFTATPFRSAGNGETSGLGDVFEHLVYSYGIGNAIADGVLVPIDAYQVSTTISIAEARIGSNGDFIEDDLTALINCESRNDLVVDKYREHMMGEPALAFCVSVQHAKDLAAQFQARGIRAEAVWGTMPYAKRKALIEEYKSNSGTLPVLCSKDLLFEGFDAPATRGILKVRPTRSRIVFTQMIGRGLRLDPGKQSCKFLDFVDNGCELDLATIADLSQAPEDEERRQIQVGDWVRRMHHDDWGKGRVRATDGETARVQWPISFVFREGAHLDHPLAELRRVLPDDADITKPERVNINPEITNVAEYEIVLLPGQPKTRTVGWYEYQRGYSASGRYSDGYQLALYTMKYNAAWQLWAIKSPPREERKAVDDEVECIGEFQSEVDAMKRGQDFMKAEKVKVQQIDADWKSDPASEGQVEALRKWGIRRDLSEVSKGEASAMMTAVVSRAKVLKAARGR